MLYRICFAFALFLVVPLVAHGDTLGLYEFNSTTDYNNADFNHPGFDSSDANVLTTAGSLEQSGGINGGGANTFLLNNSLFNTSNSGPRGFNGAGVNDGTPTEYVYFTITPDASVDVTYESLSYFSDTYASAAKIDLTVVDDGGPEQSLDSYDITATGNSSVTQNIIDFPDFTSSGVTEWRLYLWGTGNSTHGIRLDDIDLVGTAAAAAVVPEPSTFAIALFGLMGLGYRRQRRQR